MDTKDTKESQRRYAESKTDLRARQRITSTFWTPMHPAGLRCSSLAYARYARSSRLAGRAPRRPECKRYSLTGPNDHGVDVRHHDLIVSSLDTMSRREPLDILQGTLDLLILRTLQTGTQHGWAISERIEQISQAVLEVNQGSLYPALHRLEHKGWIKAEWGISDLGKRARFYQLTAAGRKQLELETESWQRLSVAIDRVLRLA